MLDAYADWLKSIKNERDALRISRRVLKLSQGHYGDYKSLGSGVSKLRFHFGPGYRVYYTLRSDGTVVILLGGGTKRHQSRDIAAARAARAGIEKDIIQ